MMTFMGKRFTNRGISTIIAALLLIAIAIAAGVLLYVFSIGLIGSLSSSGGQQVKDQLVLAAYSWPTGTKLTLYLQNVGSSSLNVTGASYFVNGALISSPTPGTTSACTASQSPGSSACSMVLPTGSASYTSGAAYPVKIVTPDGGVFSYSAIYGQSS